MARFLPSSSDPPESDADPRVVGVDSDDAGDLLSALSSGTARDMLAALHEAPAAPSEIADRAGTTLQNAQYHITKLAEAELIEVVDTVYSEKGREMKVYAPTDRPLVLFAGPEEETTGLKAALSRLLSAIGLLALGAFVLRRAVGMFSMGSAPPASGGDSATASPDIGAGGAEATTAQDAGAGGAAETLTDATGKVTAEATRTALEAATTAADGGGDLLASPTLYLVAGVAAVVLIWAALRHHRA